MIRPRALLRKALDTLKGGIWPRWGGMGWSRVRGFLPGAKHNWEAEAGVLWKNSIVGLAVSWLGDRFPRPRFQLCKIARNGDHIPVGRSDLVDLWNRPNEYYGRRTLEKAVGLSLKVDGNAYIYKVRDRMGRVRQLWWIPHERCFPTWPADGSAYIDGFNVWVDGTEHHLSASEMIHIRDGIDPDNERLGMSALKACLREACTVNMEASFTAAILKNSGTPSLAIVPDGTAPGRMDANAAKETKDKFRTMFQGDGAGDPVVLAGPYKIVPIGFSPEQLTLDKLPQNAISRIAAAIGVAPMSLGLPDPGKTYSNLAEANRTSWGTICAVQEIVADELRWQLMPDFGLDPAAYIVEYDYAHIQELQESLDAVHLRTREDWKAGLIRLAVAQEQLGYDIDPNADRYFPGTDSTATPPAPAAPGGNGAGGNGNGNGGPPKRRLDIFDKFNPAHDAHGQFAPHGGGGSGAGGGGKWTGQPAPEDATKAREMVAAAKDAGMDVALKKGAPANAREAEAAKKAEAKGGGHLAVAITETPKLETVKQGDATTHQFANPSLSHTYAKTYPHPRKEGRWVSETKTEQYDPEPKSYKTRNQALRASKSFMQEQQADNTEKSHKVAKSLTKAVAAKLGEFDMTSPFARTFAVRIKVITAGKEKAAAGAGNGKAVEVNGRLAEY